MTDRVAFALLCLLVFTIPWEKSVFVPGMGTAARVAGGLALAAGVSAAVVRRGVRLPNLVMAAAGAFVIWSGATFFWSYDPAATQARFLTLAQLFVMVWLVWDLCRTGSRQYALLGAYVAGASVASAATVFRYLQNIQTYYRRYAAPGFDPNDLGITVALAIPAALYLSSRSNGAVAWLWRAAVVLCCAAVLLTASRTALISATLGFALVPITWRMSSPAQRWAGVALFGLLAAGGFALAPKASRERISTITTEISRGTLHKRTTIWKAGLRAWKARKLTGTGAGAYPAAVQPLIGVPGLAGHEYVAHNTFLSVLVETGLIGFGVYGLAWTVLVIFVLVLRARELTFWAVMLVVWAVGASTLTWEHRKPTWLIFGLVMTEWARAFQTEPEK